MNQKEDEELSPEQWAERYSGLGDRLRKHLSDKLSEAYEKGYNDGFGAGVASVKSDA